MLYIADHEGSSTSFMPPLLPAPLLYKLYCAFTRIGSFFPFSLSYLQEGFPWKTYKKLSFLFFMRKITYPFPGPSCYIPCISLFSLYCFCNIVTYRSFIFFPIPLSTLLLSRGKLSALIMDYILVGTGWILVCTWFFRANSLMNPYP